MEIRILLAADAAAYQALRLRGLRELPTAFGSSYEEECDDPIAKVAANLAPLPTRATFGAFDEGRLVGVVSLQRRESLKSQHKALIWGMYVAPEARQRGIGRLLIDAALAHAFAMEGLRQVNLGVNSANVPAVALYEAAGFKSFALERWYMIVDGQPIHEQHMVRVRDGVEGA